jgi:Spy/CpxP family protein refolding chaperone
MNFRNIIVSSLMAAGLAAAQTATPANPPAMNPAWHRAGGPGGPGGPGGMLDELQLTDAQKAQAHQIFQDNHTAAQPIETQMRDIHQQLAAAVKSGAPDSQIDQLSNQSGALAAQMTALRTKAFAKVYALLTPDQKAKADAMGDRFLMMGPGPMGHGPRPRANQ